MSRFLLGLVMGAILTAIGVSQNYEHQIQELKDQSLFDTNKVEQEATKRINEVSTTCQTTMKEATSLCDTTLQRAMAVMQSSKTALSQCMERSR